MLWARDVRKTEGGYWRCAIKSRERDRKWREANPEYVRARRRSYYERNGDVERARVRRWYADNPDKARELNANRIYVGNAYLGRCGFTQIEREAMLSGTSK